MNSETRAVLAGCSTAILTIPLLKRGLRPTAMRGTETLAGYATTRASGAGRREAGRAR